MKPRLNEKGFTFIVAIFMVTIMGILSVSTGKSWMLVMKREREKELLFRGSQIKEAIENWYNPKYIPGGGPGSKTVTALTDLRDLMGGGQTANKNPYLPHHYAGQLDENRRCGSDCPKLFIEQDPMTGKKWLLVRDAACTSGYPEACRGVPGGGIVGVASPSDDIPIRTNFKDTALENLGIAGTGTTTTETAGGVPTAAPATSPSPGAATQPVTGGTIDKYSQWKFIADKNNDHAQIYRAYHEGL
ncbi:type II secretion system protein [Geobacter sp. SVR]|uniref:type II secretion system protein n=1 Tax=Geobacter sp. SVR TaxID=2495594 RepID=UPI00143F02CC|nr:type II secretion system protein [Geobacter sp. SVR]BCS53669.1 hypothetical protein GSVR_19770 [Geobacter sp. SVR]GCF84134.1 type II secretion system pseudopilin TklG [Geobacter sp. SVR]